MSGVARRRPTHAITATNHGTTTDPNSHRPGHVQLDRPNGARSETGGVAAPDISCQGPTSPATARNPDAQVMVRRCGLMSTPGASCRRTYRRQASSGPGEHHFQGTGFAGAGEDVVCLLELVEVEMVCHELSGVDLVALRDDMERRCGVVVDESGGDRHVLDPQVLEVQCRRGAVHTDVGDATARADE